jgi:hypothetical protein
LTPRARGLEGPATAAATAVNRELLASLARDQREDFVTTMQGIVAGAESRRP